KYILSIMDYFTKWVWLVPTRHCTARAAATQLLKRVVQEHGPPKVLISDNGPAFVATLVKDLTEMSDIDHHKTCTYHPQTNETERLNRTVKSCLRAFVQLNHGSWAKYLP